MSLLDLSGLSGAGEFPYNTQGKVKVNGREYEEWYRAEFLELKKVIGRCTLYCTFILTRNLSSARGHRVIALMWSIGTCNIGASL